MVGIISTMIEIGLTNRPKSVGAIVPPPLNPFLTALGFDIAARAEGCSSVFTMHSGKMGLFDEKICPHFFARALSFMKHKTVYVIRISVRL